MLAAGVGKRMHEVTGKLPKCLIYMGGRTLLERHLDYLSRLGVNDIVFVVGHFKELVFDAVKGHAPKGLNVRFIVNEDYKRGSILSLWCARDELDDDVLIMDADVLYHEELLVRLVESENRNCFLLEDVFEDTGEEMKLFVKGDRVVGISKHVSYECDFLGEGVGFFKLSADDCPKLKGILEEFEQKGIVDVEYEDALHVLLSRCKAGFERVDGLPWIEIDFLEDIERAEREILPAL